MDVSNLGSGDSRAEATSQLTGVFLVGLGLASLLMRPQSVTSDDLMSLVDGVETAIRDVRQEITRLQTATGATNTHLTNIIREIRDLDFSAVEGLTQTVALVITEVQDLAKKVESLLDFEVEVDLKPVTDKIARSKEQLELLIKELGNRDHSAEQLQAITTKLLSIDQSVSSHFTSLADQIAALDDSAHQDQVEELLQLIKNVSEAHKAGFDEFITHLGV